MAINHDVIVLDDIQYKAVAAIRGELGYSCKGCAFDTPELKDRDDKPCGACCGHDRTDEINVVYKRHYGKVKQPEQLGWHNVPTLEDGMIIHSMSNC